MPPEQTNDCDDLKKDVIQRYQFTADGFKNKFREAKPDKGETVFLFVARRWTELAEANGSVAAIKDLFIREQLINTCSRELALFLKERVPKTIDEATQLAEQYLEAHGGALNTQRPGSNRGVHQSQQSTTKQQQPATTRPDAEPSDKSRNNTICFYCEKRGHFARECRSKKGRRKARCCSNGEGSQRRWFARRLEKERVVSTGPKGAETG